ncbi:MAG: HNH endonuclease [Flavobacteriaceae bacterium]|nr:HNH endonuclease [Flavobacteriaceae bacterium]
MQTKETPNIQIKTGNMNTSSKVANIWQNTSIENLKDEFWFPYPKNPKQYLLSNLGRLKGVSNSAKRVDGTGFKLHKIIKQFNNRQNPTKGQPGYLKTSVRINGKTVNKYIHRMVAETFIGEIPKTHHVDHIDGNTFNNCIDNLRIISITKNTGKKGGKNNNAKLSKEQVEEIRKIGRSISGYKVAEMYNVSSGTIYHILQNRTWND